MVNEKSGSQNVRQFGGSVGVCNLIPREKESPWEQGCGSLEDLVSTCS